MKHTKATLAAVALTAWALSSCGNQEKKDPAWVAPQHETVIRQMPELRVADSLTVGNRHYTYEITRQPSDSLPKVRDDVDDLYRDNTVRLVLHRNGTPFFDKTFTKATFAPHLESDFCQNAILDGIRFVRAEPGQGLVFSFAVSYPDSDMSVPFLMTVTDQGTYTLLRDENLDREEGDTVYLDDGV